MKLAKSKLHLNKHTRLALALSLAAIFIVAVAILLNLGDSKTQDVSRAKPVKSACKMFSFNNAVGIMGNSTVPNRAASRSDKANTGRDVLTSRCSYSQRGANAKNGKLSASVIIKEARTPSAKAKLQQDFNNQAKSGAELGVYGQASFWDASKGQINVLKANHWYVLTFGKLKPSARNVSQSEQLADYFISSY